MNKRKSKAKKIITEDLKAKATTTKEMRAISTEIRDQSSTTTTTKIALVHGYKLIPKRKDSLLNRPKSMLIKSKILKKMRFKRSDLS